jgi:hypothetical protein
LRAVSARQCKDFLPTVDSANCPWPTWRRSAAGLFAVGQRVARSFPERWPAEPAAGDHADTVQGHQLAHKGGAAWSLPLSNRSKMDALILNRASASRSSGEWNDDDFDVLADGVVRIFKANAAPEGTPWLWTLDRSCPTGQGLPPRSSRTWTTIRVWWHCRGRPRLSRPRAGGDYLGVGR